MSVDVPFITTVEQAEIFDKYSRMSKTLKNEKNGFV